MKTTVTWYTFRDAVVRHDRLEQFGSDGWRALFDYIEDYERDTGEEQELDIIALCCDFTRYESLAEFNQEQGEECETMQDVSDLTLLVLIDGDDDDIAAPFIVANY
jgi:hypothetical protein